MLPTKYINIETTFNRSGMIFYYTKNDKINFILAIDSTHGELTDFGGGLYEENFISCAIREASEESMNIFDFTDNIDFIKNNSISIYNNNMVILFQKVDIEDMEKVFIEYKKIYKDSLYRGLNKKYLENTFIISINEDNLKNLLNENNNKDYKELPKYMESNILLEDYMLNLISKDYRRDIKTYPLIYDRVKKLIKPVYNDLIRFIKNCN